MSIEIQGPSTTVSGEYKIVVNKADGTSEEYGWFPNLITNAGLNSFGNDGLFNSINAAYVGTSDSTPQYTDTDLTAVLARTRTVQSSSRIWRASAPYFSGVTRQYRFAPGAVIGTIKEVGVGWYTGPVSGVYTYYLFSHALILDGEGNPTSITLTSEDSLDIFYTLRIYPPTTDATGTVVLNGITYNWTARAYRASVPWGSDHGSWIAPCGSIGESASVLLSGDIVRNLMYAYNKPIITSQNTLISDVSGGTFAAVTSTGNVYVTNSFSRTISASWGLADGNLTGSIQAIGLPSGFACYQIGFSPAIPKDGTCTLTLSFTHTWARKES